jgi:DNA-binding response OmpR family regulator
VAKRFEGKSILVVDDDEDILGAIEVSFSSAGAKTSKAMDGNAAIDAALRERPDLIVLDMMLPKRSGFLVLERLKKGKPRGSKPYVIMITGNEGKRHQQYALAIGADDYIYKPFPMGRLLDSAERLLAAQQPDDSGGSQATS